MTKAQMQTRVKSLLIDALDDENEAKDVFNRLCKLNFFDAPASTRYHGNYPGGLAEHSLNVTAALLSLRGEWKDCSWKLPRSPIIVGLFHDLCKCDQYNVTMGVGGGVANIDYRKDCVLKGHGDKSVMLASTLLRLTDEEVLCIRYHMGAFCEKEEWADYTRAIHTCPTVLMTHTADMIAAHIMER